MKTSGRNRSTASNLRAGFTLLELLIVLAIIVVIAGMVVPNFIGQQETAKIRSTKGAISGVESAIDYYFSDHGKYPEGGQDVLDTLMEPQQTKGGGKPKQPYLLKPPRDAWGRKLYYEWQKGGGHSKADNAYKPAIWSAGPNGVNDDGGNDDINNWTVDQEESAQ